MIGVSNIVGVGVINPSASSSSSSAGLPAYEALYFNTSTPYTQATTVSEIETALNTAGFTIEEGKLYVFKIRAVRSTTNGFSLVEESYKFKNNNITGTWGTGSINGVVVFSDFIYEDSLTIISTLTNDNIVYSLGDIGAQTIQFYLNNLDVNTLDFMNGDGWENLLNDGTVYTFHCIINGLTHVYDFIGSLPKTIGLGNDTVFGSDFDLITFTGDGKTKLSELLDDIGATEKEIVKVTNKSQIVNQDLDPTKVYFLLQSIALTSTERIRVNNLQLLYGLGHDIVTISTSEPNSVIFESTGAGCTNIKVYSLSLVAGGTNSQPFNVKDIDGTHEIRLKGVNFNGCQNLGIYDGFRQGFWDDIGFYGCQNGMELKGAWNGFKLFNSNVFGFSATGTFIKKGTGLVFSNRFFLNLNFDFPIGAILTDFEEANFALNELFQINSSIAKRNGVLDISNSNILLPNISANSLKSLWIGNIGLPDTATEVLVENLNTSGTFEVDWLKDTYYLQMTGNTVFTEKNLPASTKNTQEIKIYLTGAFTPTFPANWIANLVGTYKGSDVNEISIKFIKSNLYFMRISNSLSVYPAPSLQYTTPLSLTPSSTAQLDLIGSFFTPQTIVSIEGQTVNSIEFINSSTLRLSVTTSAIEGEYDITISNGTSIVFTDAFVVNLGEVFVPQVAEWENIVNAADVSEGKNVKVSTYDANAYATWNKLLDRTKNFEIRFRFTVSELGSPQGYFQFMNVSLLNASDLSKKLEYWIKYASNYVQFIAHENGTATQYVADQYLPNGTSSEYKFINEVQYQTYKIKHIGGVLYFYRNNTLKFTHAAVLTENVKLKIGVKTTNISDIKYIELP
jgi:hypothetical protein